MSLETEIRALLGADSVTAQPEPLPADKWLADASKADPQLAQEIERAFPESLNLADSEDLATLPAIAIDPPTGRRVRQLAAKRGKSVHDMIGELVRRGLAHTVN